MARVCCSGYDCDVRAKGAVSCAAGLCTALPSSAKSVTKKSLMLRRFCGRAYISRSTRVGRYAHSGSPSRFAGDLMSTAVLTRVPIPSP